MVRKRTFDKSKLNYLLFTFSKRRTFDRVFCLCFAFCYQKNQKKRKKNQNIEFQMKISWTRRRLVILWWSKIYKVINMYHFKRPTYNNREISIWSFTYKFRIEYSLYLAVSFFQTIPNSKKTRNVNGKTNQQFLKI